MKDSTVRTVRTWLQGLFAAAAAVPSVAFLFPKVGLSTTAGIGLTVVTAAAAITRVHAIPAVSDFLNKYFKIPQ